MKASVRLTLRGSYCIGYCIGRKEEENWILCRGQFCDLMIEELPDRIIVTASTRPIADSARVAVKLKRTDKGDLWGFWYSWDCRIESLYNYAAYLLHKRLGLPLDEWRNVWVTWKEAKP